MGGEFIVNALAAGDAGDDAVDGCHFVAVILILRLSQFDSRA